MPDLRPLVGVLSLVAGCLASQPVIAAGTAVAVSPSTTVSGAGGARALTAGSRVVNGEVIQTGPSGEAQLLFDDQTRIVIGPNARFALADVSLGRSSSRFTVNALGGAFRFITGNSPSSAYSIRTPTATMGVRGTSFDVAVRPGGTDLALLEGRVRFCGPGGGCFEVSQSCAIVGTGGPGGIGEVRDANSRARIIRERFPYIVSQARLQPAFRAPTQSCGVSAVPVAPGGGSAPATPPAPPSPSTPPAIPSDNFPGRSGQNENANSEGRGGGASHNPPGLGGPMPGGGGG